LTHQGYGKERIKKMENVVIEILENTNFAKKTESKYVENTKNVDSNFGKNWTVSSARTGCRVPQELDGEFGENMDRGTRQ
jgi:hypothetical protein